MRYPAREEDAIMSASNGDKARFWRQRKARIQRKIRMRGVVKAAQDKAAKTPPSQG